MRSTWIVAVAVGIAIVAVPASASPLYSTTDLGTSYQLQTDANGHVRSVIAADGTSTYAFDKSPVTQLTDPPIPLSNHTDSYTLYTLQSGDHKVGFNSDRYFGLTIHAPTFEALSNGWFTYSGTPVLDINAGGQAVGYSSRWSQQGSYAAFSTPTGGSHGFGAAYSDNLNNSINPLPDVTLTAAVKIDDLGRILATASDGHSYLLNPTELGLPQPIPEPTTLMLLGTVAAWTAIRSWHRAGIRPGGGAKHPRPELV